MNDISNVFIVDDDASVRDSLAMQMETAGYDVSTYSGADDFLDVCTPETRGCIILDVNMPDMDGPALQRELTRRNLILPIIFLSGQGTIPLTVRTMKAGAIDFMTKPVDGSLLRTRVQEALERCSRMQSRDRNWRDIAARLESLTSREREVMKLAIEGLTSKEIALRLSISYRTVETHRTRLILKTGTSSMLELARIVALQDSR
jgi:FixJ family two-component response regulator